MAIRDSSALLPWEDNVKIQENTLSSQGSVMNRLMGNLAKHSQCLLFIVNLIVISVPSRPNHFNGGVNFPIRPIRLLMELDAIGVRK